MKNFDNVHTLKTKFLIVTVGVIKTYSVWQAVCISKYYFTKNTTIMFKMLEH